MEGKGEVGGGHSLSTSSTMASMAAPIATGSVVNTGVPTSAEALPSLKSLMQLKKKYDAPDIGSLPEGYKKNSEKERLYLWSADNFRRQINHRYPTLKPLCLTSRNECGTKKLAMTFIRVIY